MTHSHSHLADLLDLDVEVLADYHREVIAWAGAQVPPRGRIVDLGAGSGAGSLALARQLKDAEIIAVDMDDEMLAHLRHRAGDLPVRTVRADLDQTWPADLGPADLVWASASLHHLADPAHALAQAFALLKPGGAMMVTELESFPRFLPEGPDGDVEARCHEAAARLRDEHGMHMHEDWGARLTDAGLAVEESRVFDIVLTPPLPPAAGHYAEATFARMRHGLEGRIPEADLAAIARLAGSVAGRDDLTIRTTRTAWLARRP